MAQAYKGSLRRDWLLIAQALALFGVVLAIFAWQIRPHERPRDESLNATELEAGVSERLARSAQQIERSLSLNPFYAQTAESNASLLSDLEQLAWRITSGNNLVHHIDYYSANAFMRLERIAPSGRLLWLRNSSDQAPRAYRQTSFGDRSTSVISQLASEPRTPLNTAAIARLPSDRWTALGSEFERGALWVTMGKRIDEREETSIEGVTAGPRYGLLLAVVQLTDMQAVSLLAPPLPEKQTPAWLRDDTRGQLWHLYDPSNAAIGAADGMPTDAQIDKAAQTSPNSSSLQNNSLLATKMPVGLEWVTVNLPWLKASVGVARPGTAEHIALHTRLMWLCATASVLFFILSVLVLWMRQRFNADLRQLAGVLSFAEGERRNLLPQNFRSREFIALSSLVKRQAQQSIGSTQSASDAQVIASSTALNASVGAPDSQAMPSQYQDSAAAPNSVGPDSTFNSSFGSAAVTERDAAAANSVSNNSPMTTEKSLREAYASARQWQSSYHKLRGRTQAEIAAKLSQVDEARQQRAEIEDQYLGALSEMDALKVQLKKAQLRQPIAVSFKPLQILLLEDNPVARKLFDNALAKLRYRADIVANIDEAEAAMAQVAYQAIIIGASTPRPSSQAVVSRIRKAAEPGHPMLIWLERASHQADVLDTWPLQIDAILPSPVQLPALQNVLDRVSISLYQSEFQPSQLPGSASPAEAVILNPVTMQQHRTLDNDAPEPFMREVIVEFAASIAQTIADINRYAATQNWNQFARSSHKLRGTSLTLGADRLEKLCKLMEQAGDDGENDPAIKLLDDFEKTAKATALELQAAALEFKASTAPH